MSDVKIAVILMCVMGIAFAMCIKLMFDAFVVHLRNQSDLTTRAVKQAGEALALNSRFLTAFEALVAQRIEQGSSNPEVAGSIPAERTINLPTIPDEDGDFSPDMARKIIARYQEIIHRLTKSAPSDGASHNIGERDPSVMSDSHGADTSIAQNLPAEAGAVSLLTAFTQETSARNSAAAPNASDVANKSDFPNPPSNSGAGE